MESTLYSYQIFMKLEFSW